MTVHIRPALGDDDIRRADELLDRSKQACAPVEKAANEWHAWLEQSELTMANLAVGMRLAMQLAQILADALRALQEMLSFFEEDDEPDC